VPISAVVDTNVIHDLSSCADVTRALDNAFGRQPVPVAVANRAEVARDPEAAYRFRRAREAMLLARYLSRIRTHSYGMRDEMLAVILAGAPPEERDTIQYLYAAMYAHFIKDYLLTHWRQSCPSKPDLLRSNTADQHLLEYAREHSLPLITNEGNGMDGIEDVGLRLKAKEAGVAVFTAGQFYEGKIDERREIDSFFDDFRSRVPRYLRRATRLGKQEREIKHLQVVFNYLRMVLCGEIDR
jgi:hypothetical protein